MSGQQGSLTQQQYELISETETNEGSSHEVIVPCQDCGSCVQLPWSYC